MERESYSRKKHPKEILIIFGKYFPQIVEENAHKLNQILFSKLRSWGSKFWNTKFGQKLPFFHLPSHISPLLLYGIGSNFQNI